LKQELLLLLVVDVKAAGGCLKRSIRDEVIASDGDGGKWFLLAMPVERQPVVWIGLKVRGVVLYGG
jgi:hypothetical protein